MILPATPGVIAPAAVREEQVELPSGCKRGRAADNRDERWREQQSREAEEIASAADRRDTETAEDSSAPYARTPWN
jgi:hypothetical protein